MLMKTANNTSLYSSDKPIVDLGNYNNDWFKEKIGAGMFKQAIWYFINILFFKNSLNLSSGLKTFLLRLFGAKLGTGVVIKPGVNIKYPWKLKVGDQVWIGENVWIDNLDEVKIENNVCISQGAMLLCGNHNYKSTGFDLMIGPIILKEGSWVGAQAIVCPNVTLHPYSILTVGSVASKDLEAFGIYSGNPARFVRERKIAGEESRTIIQNHLFTSLS